MTGHATEISPRLTASPQLYARLAGALYLVIIVFGIWSELFVRASLIVADDAAATAANIRASEVLFRLSFAADSIMALSDVAVAVLLYVLLKPVSATLAVMAMAFRLVQTAILGVNLLFHYAALLILNGTDTASAFDPQQLNALVALTLEIHAHGYDLGLIFFGLSCLVLGALIARSGYLPRLLGYLVMAAGAVYLIGSYTLFLAPGYAGTTEPLYLIPLVAELALCLWLLVKGIDVERWQARKNEGHVA
jgi:Domain of unknown function (DUF4386)